MATKSTKSTSPTVAKKASAILKGGSTGKPSKSVSGSALAQVEAGKVSSKKAATTASKVLRDGRTSDKSKSAAGSVLSQGPAKKAVSSPGTNSGGPRKKK
jgi:hypothetical protein